MKAILKNLKVDDNTTIMYCPICGDECSANLSDYWAITNPKNKFYCCHRTMDLVVKKTIYQPV